MLKISDNKISKVILNRILLVLLALVIFIGSVTSALLITNRRNDIALASSCGSVFDPIPAWVNQRIDENRNIYQQVANETGVPWEMIAAVHYREFNLRRDINPANGQGIYQMYSIYQTNAEYRQLATSQGVSDDNFLRQTRFAANFIQDKAQNTTRTPVVSPRKLVTNDSDLNLIKSTLFSYNGRASAYANQAEQLGFNKTNLPFEGSPYVMSKFDCKRASMGLITSDGSNSLTGVDTRLGAFTLMARLKGDGYWSSLQVGNIPGCTEATGTRISCVWRLFNPGTSRHTFTTSYDERNMLIASGYLYEGVAFYGINVDAPGLGNVPVYHLRNNANGSLLTTDRNEYTVLLTHGWSDKGVAFYADPAGSNTGYATYRMYNERTGNHYFATEDQLDSVKKAGFTQQGEAFAATSVTRQEVAPSSGQRLVYRFGSMPGNRHFWTTDIYERDNMINAGYRYEGVAWTAVNSATNSPVYRLYSSSMQKHLFTTDSNEKDVLGRTSSWSYEGIAWYSSGVQTERPVYRLYAAYNAHHFYTTDSYERDQLVRSGVFKDEGTGWYQP